MQQDVLLFQTHRQIQHQRTEQTSQQHRQGRVPGGAHQPSERKWKEPRVPGASVDRVDVRAGTGGPHLLLRQTRGTRGMGEHGSGGRVEKAMHSGRLSLVTMDARWTHPFTSIVAGPTGCGKCTFVTRMLRHAAAIIDPPPERITWCYGEWQNTYATIDLADVRFEEGLPSASMFDSTIRNLIVIDDFMAETDERVTILFTKKAITRTRPCCISYRTCSLKTKRVVP